MCGSNKGIRTSLVIQSEQKQNWISITNISLRMDGGREKRERETMRTTETRMYNWGGEKKCLRGEEADLRLSSCSYKSPWKRRGESARAKDRGGEGFALQLTVGPGVVFVVYLVPGVHCWQRFSIYYSLIPLGNDKI